MKRRALAAALVLAGASLALLAWDGAGNLATAWLLGTTEPPANAHAAIPSAAPPSTVVPPPVVPTAVERETIAAMLERGAPHDEMREALAARVDDEAVARRTLGDPCPPGVAVCVDHWHEDLTEEQRKQVTSLLRELVATKVRERARDMRDYELRYRGVRGVGGGLTKVRTEAKDRARPAEPPIHVDFVVSERDAIVDVVTEGSSMTKNYYDQFHRMLTTTGQGYPYLVAKLEAKAARSHALATTK